MLTLPFAVSAQGSTGCTKELGDAAYSEARYNDAIAIYENLITNEGGSLPLCYNLGNAYFRSSHFGKAILNYERALKYDANDADTKANLAYAQSLMLDKLPEDDVPFYQKWGNSILGIFSENVWAIIGIASFIAMLISLFFYFFKNNLRKTSIIVAAISIIIVILANISASKLHSRATNHTAAIILDEMVIVKSSPESSGTELTKIHEGLKVKILDEALKEWIKIEADNGNKVVGWVKATSLERI